MLIAASVVILLLPSTRKEGFALQPEQYLPSSKVHAKPTLPVAAGQRNSSSTASTADGSTNNKHLMDRVLQKHDRLAEAFENRKTNAVSATTTKKKGIASTSATTDEGNNVNIPTAGCNKNCVEIGTHVLNPDYPKKSSNKYLDFSPTTALEALGGNCINPPKANGKPHEVDYSIKFCPAYRAPDGSSMLDEKCITCGYYKFKGTCTKRGPNAPCDYENYTYIETIKGPMPSPKKHDNGDDSSGPTCSTCKLNVNKTTKCVLPGCYSAHDGYLPFPDDGGYNFAEGCFYYNPDPSNPKKTLPGMQGREPGYYCPPITQGQQYDGGGSSGDSCYTKPNSIPDTANPNQPGYTLDYSKFVKMDKVCSNDKQKSNQNFVPDDVDDTPYSKRRQSASKTSATASSINHEHQHGGAINVFHHHMYSSGQGKSTENQGAKRGKGAKSTYMEPEAGATVLGFI